MVGTENKWEMKSGVWLNLRKCAWIDLNSTRVLHFWRFVVRRVCIILVHRDTVG